MVEKPSLSRELAKADSIEKFNKVLNGCDIKVGRFTGGREVFKEGYKGKELSINDFVKKLDLIFKNQGITSQNVDEYHYAIEKIKTLDEDGKEDLRRAGWLRKKLTGLRRMLGSGSYPRASVIEKIDEAADKILNNAPVEPVRNPFDHNLDQLLRRQNPALEGLLAFKDNGHQKRILNKPVNPNHAKNIEDQRVKDDLLRIIQQIKQKINQPLPLPKPLELPVSAPLLSRVENARDISDDFRFAFDSGDFICDRHYFLFNAETSARDTPKFFAFCPSRDGEVLRYIRYDPKADPKAQVHTLEDGETLQSVAQALTLEGFKKASEVCKDSIHLFNKVTKNVGDKLTEVEKQYLLQSGQSGVEKGDYCLCYNTLGEASIAFVKHIDSSGIAHLETRYTQEDVRYPKQSLIKLGNNFNLVELPKPEPAIEAEEYQNPFAHKPAGFGIRTERAVQFFGKYFPDFDVSGTSLNVKGVFFEMISGSTVNISKNKLASIGSSASREIILLDPDNSQLLNLSYRVLRHAINNARARGELKSDEDVLNFTISYMRSSVFPSCRDLGLEKKVDEFVKKRQGGPSIKSRDHSLKIPLIPIDEFLKEKVGVCRHHALVLSYFIDKMTKETSPILEGVVQHMRDNIKSRSGDGAHVWCTFISKSGRKWHVDSLWNELVDFTEPDGEAELASLYGKKMKDNQVKRVQATFEAMMQAGMITP